jgi:hypothetical protein
MQTREQQNKLPAIQSAALDQPSAVLLLLLTNCNKCNFNMIAVVVLLEGRKLSLRTLE